MQPGLLQIFERFAIRGLGAQERLIRLFAHQLLSFELLVQVLNLLRSLEHPRLLIIRSVEHDALRAHAVAFLGVDELALAQLVLAASGKGLREVLCRVGTGQPVSQERGQGRVMAMHFVHQTRQFVVDQRWMVFGQLVEGDLGGGRVLIE